MVLPYDPAFPLLKLYLKKPETLTQKDICTPTFIVALFIIAKLWKQPKLSSVGEWIKKKNLWHIYTMEYYSPIKKKEIDLENIMLSEKSQSEKRQIPYDFTYIWKLTK